MSNKIKPKISLDFDGTLGHILDVQEYCKHLLSKGVVDVYITTRRYGSDSKGNPQDPWWTNIGTKNWTEVFDLADELGILRSHIHFCNMEPKYEYFNTPYFLWHLDDDQLECEDINLHTITRGIWLGENWLEQCNKLINETIS